METRKTLLALGLAVLLLLSGCGKKEDSTTGQDAGTILRVMLGALEEREEKDALLWYLEPEEVEGCLRDFYRLEGLELLDGAVLRMEGARAFELAVLRTDGGEAVAEALQDHLLDRQGAFTGYFPNQAELAERGLVLTRGDWAALAVCREPDSARSAFESCFGDGVNARGIPAVLGPGPEDLRPDGRLYYRDPGLDDMTLYDTAPILAAWESGEASGLSQKDRQVLDRARAVLEEWTDAGMDEYGRERAVYAWLTTHVAYDHSHYSAQGAPRTSYEPYGPLVEGAGVCLGYASAFQLLMDMAGVECVTVTGAAFGNRENHAWNMVRLDGTWYCVDATWDHNSFNGDFLEFQSLELDRYWRYFNVTSDYMAGTDHQWDYDSVPEAEQP